MVLYSHPSSFHTGRFPESQPKQQLLKVRVQETTNQCFSFASSSIIQCTCTPFFSLYRYEYLPCRPQPVHVAFPQFKQETLWHIANPVILYSENALSVDGRMRRLLLNVRSVVGVFCFAPFCARLSDALASSLWRGAGLADQSVALEETVSRSYGTYWYNRISQHALGLAACRSPRINPPPVAAAGRCRPPSDHFIPILIG
jgi:hypothetical protein